MNASLRWLTPLLILFAGIFAIIFFLSSTLDSNHIDSSVLYWANALLFIISFFSAYLQKAAMKNKNPNVFVRTVMASMMVKMLLCVIIIVIYFYSSGINFNKSAVFISLFLYLIYLSTEVYIVMKLNKNKKADG